MNNFKRIMSIILLVIVAMVAFGCTPKNDNTDDVLALVECREQAIAEVESYAQGLGEANYTEGKWTELQDIVRDTITAIQTLNSKDEISGLVSQAKTDIDNVVTYKEQMVAEIESYAQSKGQDNYTEEKWTELQEIVRDTITAIQTLNSKDEIAGYVVSAKTDMDNLLKIYQEQSIAEIESYVQGLGEQNYSENNWKHIDSIEKEGKALIEAAEQKTIAEKIKSETMYKIGNVLTITYKFEVIQQIQSYVNGKEAGKYAEKSSIARNAAEGDTMWTLVSRVLQELVEIAKEEIKGAKTKLEVDEILLEKKNIIDEGFTAEKHVVTEIPEEVNQEIETEEQEGRSAKLLGCYNDAYYVLRTGNEQALQQKEIDGVCYIAANDLYVSVYKDRKWYNVMDENTYPNVDVPEEFIYTTAICREDYLGFALRYYRNYI